MYNTHRELYASLGEYLSELVNDKVIAMRLVEVFIKADIPLQIFATTVKLYKMILSKREVPGRECGSGLAYSDPSLKTNKPSTRFPESKSQKISYLASIQAVPPSEIVKLFSNSYITIIACCIISCKYYRDVAFTNDSWEQVTSIDMHTLNNAERLSLMLLDYEISSLGDNQIIERIRSILQGKNMDMSGCNQNSERKVKTLVKKLFCLS